MIDLHCHILPGIDDGAKTLQVSLEMARMAVEDGIHTMACTPHIYPGLYMNDSASITAARDALQGELDAHGIALRLLTGADIHLVPGLLDALKFGQAPTLAGSHYVLLEPSHHVAPPKFEDSVFSLVAAGYTPVITHPERLHWIEDHSDVFRRLVRQGAWMQVTAGALSGVFGPRAKYWGEWFLGEGLTHILATDAHSSGRRVPRLSEARAIAERLLGKEEADKLVLGRPQAIVDDRPPAEFSLSAGSPQTPARHGGGWLQRLLGRR